MQSKLNGKRLKEGGQIQSDKPSVHSTSFVYSYAKGKLGKVIKLTCIGDGR
jgi:hypothetical protein